MSMKESAKTGFVERATVEVIAPVIAPVGRPSYHVTPGWYWYQEEPVYVYLHDSQWIVRGYNFTTKEEWRRTDIDLSELEAI